MTAKPLTSPTGLPVEGAEDEPPPAAESEVPSPAPAAPPLGATPLNIKRIDTSAACVVAKSTDIKSLMDAVAYSRERLVGEHPIDARGKPAIIRIDEDASHHFTCSDEDSKAPPFEQLYDEDGNLRCLDLSRAWLMDRLINAIANFHASLQDWRDRWQLFSKINGAPVKIVLRKERNVFPLVTWFSQSESQYKEAMKKRDNPRFRKPFPR